MISQSSSISEFIQGLADKEYHDVIYLTEQEATEAERTAYRERAHQEFAHGARELGLSELLADRATREALPMPGAMTPLPRHEAGTAANYLWWLSRPAALRMLPLPSERLAQLLRRSRG